MLTLKGIEKVNSKSVVETLISLKETKLHLKDIHVLPLNANSCMGYLIRPPDFTQSDHKRSNSMSSNPNARLMYQKGINIRHITNKILVADEKVKLLHLTLIH